MKKLLFALCLASLFASCTKDATVVNKSIVPEQKNVAIINLITENDWTMAKVERVNADVYEDMSANVADCEKDDFMRFEADFSLQHHNGETLCDTNQPQASFGRWALISATEMEILEGGKTTLYAIKELEKGIMVLTTVDNEEVHQMTFYAR